MQHVRRRQIHVVLVIYILSLLLLASPQLANAQTLTLHVGNCHNVEATSKIVNPWDYARTYRLDAYNCVAMYLVGSAADDEYDYLCTEGWQTINVNCWYFAEILAMAHTHNVCDDLTGLCYGYVGTSDS